MHVIKKILTSLMVMLLIINSLKAQDINDNKQQNMTTINNKGTRAPQEYFTGTVWVNMNVKAEDSYNTLIGTVTFEPKGRTNWHTHTTGQILLVTDGIGYYQEKGKPIQLIRKGDVVKIPKNVEHWHGASLNSSMTHIAIVPELDKDKTEWLAPVTDEEYNSFK